MGEQPARALADGLRLLAQGRGGAVARQARLQLAQVDGQRARAFVVGGQRHAQRRVVLLEHRWPVAVRHGAVGARAGRLRRRAVGVQRLDALGGRRGGFAVARVDRDRVVGEVAVPRRDQLLHALVQPRDVASIGLQDALQAVLLARRRPLAAAALEAAGEPLDGLRPALGQRDLGFGRALDEAARGVPVGALHRLRELLALGAVLEQARRDAVVHVPGLGAGRGRRRRDGRRCIDGRGAALLDPGAGVVLGRGFQLGQRQAAQRGLGGLGGGRFGHGGDLSRPGSRSVSTSADRRRRHHRHRSAPWGQTASTAPCGAARPAPATPGCPPEATAC